MTMIKLDLTRILNLCKLGTDGLVSEYPSLKKYLTGGAILPKKPLSDLEKRIRSRGEEVKELYESLSNNPGALFEIYEFSNLLQEKYALRLEQAHKIKDPAEENEKLAEIFGQIRTEIIQALGLADVDKELSHEERLSMSLQFGGRYFGQ